MEVVAASGVIITFLYFSVTFADASVTGEEYGPITASTLSSVMSFSYRRTAVDGADWSSYTTNSIFRPSSPPCRSEEHTSELQSQSHISYAVSCLNKKKVRSRSAEAFVVGGHDHVALYYQLS